MRSTDPNQENLAPGRTRREVLRRTALVALVGATTPMTACGVFGGDPEPPPAPDPLAPLVSGALDLAARYDAAIAAFPDLADRLRPVAEAHRAHAAELARVTGTALPSTTPAAPPVGAGDADAVLAELREAEQQGREAATRVCVQAPANRAALVGSIVAARAAHREVVLR